MNKSLMKQKIQECIARNIRSVRTVNGITQTELGSFCGLSEKAIYAIESGKRNIKADELVLIADGLGVKPETLLVNPNTLR